MPEIVLETEIHASAERCFDLVRDIRVHTETTAHTDERAVAGVTDGRIGLGQTVTFEGTHFGIRQQLTVIVIEFDRPRRFVDAMIKGRFKYFAHIHEFEENAGTTIMRDTVFWESPLGVLGRIFDKLLLERHMTKLVSTRNAKLKEIAQADN